MNTKLILLEATEYTDGTSLAKAILRGQIAGVSKKFFNGEEPNTEALDKFLQIVKTNFDKPLQNKVIVLLLNKAKTIDNLKHIDNQIIDATKTYFSNINKEEAKKPEVKELFNKFEEAGLTDSFNQEFENKINKIFADFAEMKSADEYEVIYPTDKDGWEVAVPKTFGAAKYLASIKGVGKAFWCTAAHEYHFKDYTENGNKLYIIRNVKKGILYQMDWGYQDKNWQSPSFQNFNNESITIKEAKENIPKKVLQAIKNKDGESVAELLKKSDDIIEGKPEEKQIDKWKYKLLTKTEFLKLIKKYKIDIDLNSLYITGYAREVLKKEDANKIKCILLENGDKKYLFILTKEIITINLRIVNFPLFELKKDGTYDIVGKDVLADAKNIPDEIKEYIYTKHEIEKPDYTDYSTEDYNIYLIRNTAGLRKILSNEEYNKIKHNLSLSKKQSDIYIEKVITKIFKTNKKFRLLFISNKKEYKKTLIINLNNIENSLRLESFNLHFNSTNLNYINGFISKDKILYNFINEKFPSVIREIEKNKKDSTAKYIQDLKTNFIFKSFLTIDNKKFFAFSEYGPLGLSYFYDKFKNKYDFSNIKNSNIIKATPIIYVENNKIYNLDKQTYEKYKVLINKNLPEYLLRYVENFGENYLFQYFVTNLKFKEKQNKKYFDEQMAKIKDRVRNRITES